MVSQNASTTISFSRPPRRYALPPSETITVQAPAAAVTPPSISLASLLLPSLGIGLSLGLLAIFSRGSSPVYLLFSLPMMVLSVGAGVFNFVTGRRRYQHAVAERVTRFQRYLATTRLQLNTLRAEQWDAETAAHPEPPTWLARARARDAALWERTPRDRDFLTLRLGVGPGPISFSIKPPPAPPVGQDEDPLLTAASQLAEEFSQAPQSPVCLDFRGLEAVAAYGERPRVLCACRAWLVEAAAAHGPDELRMMCLYAPSERDAWRWVRWLPHVQVKTGGRALAETADEARRLLTELTEQRRQAAEAETQTLVVVADLRLVDFSLMRALRVLAGSAVTFLFLVERAADAPKDCRALIEAGEARSWLRLVGPPPLEQPYAADEMDLETAERFARTLAPLRLDGADHVDLAVPPRAALFPWLDLSPEALAERWRTAQPWESLAVPIGLLEGGAPLMLDLHERAHGPHGIVGGTTGSGKSELLQTILLSLAANFSPRDLAFLVVDFKGEGMVRAVASLPHIVGVVSNIESQTTRALVSLKAELTRRQVQFSRVGVSHIDQYQRLSREHPDWPPLPRLFIVVDEFAELAATQPECLKDLVSSARLGRSLGVSLLLATQKPSGVISEQIWSNSRFRICLRVATTGDSHDVLHRPDAAGISGRLPGRAYFQVGADEVFLEFQTLYAASPYQPDLAREAAEAIIAMSASGERRRLYPPPAPESAGTTELEVLLERLTAAAAAEKLERLPALWLPPLPEQLLLADLPPSPSALAPVIGLLDDPVRRLQTPLSVDLRQHGHLLIAGGPKTGKTTLLLTLVLAMAQAAEQGEVNFYLLDYGNRQLKWLEALPHVGAVILPDETERQQRLWRWLDREVDRRREALGAAGMANWTAYRQTQTEAGPELVLAIDNYPELAAAWQEAANYIARLIRDGASLGIHVVFTLTGANAPYRLLSNLSLVLALELADALDYTTLVGRPEVLPTRGVRGRGLVKGEPVLEFQAALPAPGDDTERAGALRSRVEKIRALYRGRRPYAIRERPAVVQLADVLAEMNGTLTGDRFPVGLDPLTLEPLWLDLAIAAHCVITGTAGGGKSSLLTSLALSVAATHSPQAARFFVANFKAPTLAPLAAWPHTAAYVSQPDEMPRLLEALRAEVEARRQRAAQPGGNADRSYLVLVIDDYDFGPCRANAEQWLALFQAGLPLGLRVWLSGSATAFGNILDRVAGAVKAGGAGFVVASTEAPELAVLNVRLPLAEQGRPLPRGMALLVQGGQHRRVQWVVAGEPSGWSSLLRRADAGTERPS